MFQSILRTAAVAASVATLTSSLGAASAQAPTVPNEYEYAWVEVTRGRAVLLGSEEGCQTIRSGDREDTTGRSQLEIPTGSEAKITWPGACSVRVYGPSSIEWTNQGSTLGMKFHEITWADFECRKGEHELFLPSDWSGTFGRSAFHVRGITGGPCELRLQAGTPVALQWEGDDRYTLPPVHVYPGSSVRLDRPRFRNAPTAQTGSTGTWEMEESVSQWPWSPVSYPGQPAGSQVGGTSASVPTGGEGVTYSTESESTCYAEEEAMDSTLCEMPEMCQEGFESATAQPITYAQAPVTPVEPTVEMEVSEGAEGEQGSNGSEGEPTKAQPEPQPDPGPRPEPEPAPEPEPEPEPAVYTPDQWRGFDMSELNHAGSIVAERSSDVEYRILGQGRCKIIVSSSATEPRWCFTPKVDLQMQPGSVAIIEKDGTLRMSFGEVQEFDAPADRPAFDEFED